MYSKPNGTVSKSIGVEKQLVKEFIQINPRDPSPLMEAQGDVAQLGVNFFIMLLLL
jgi:hypothetical protein